nr:retrovirus-related Pol polyprotein from transposon TNT 1-94 [Tanacetum cinerariifolium]
MYNLTNINGVASKTTKEKVKSLALKAKVTRDQTSDDNDSLGESNEDINEEEAEAFNLLSRNFRKGNRFGCGNLLAIGPIGLVKAAVMVLKTKVVKAQSKKELTTIACLFTSYMAYDDGHVVFGSNLKCKVGGGGNITHDSITITNVAHVSDLAFNLISIGPLCDDDCVVSFPKVDCDISKNGKLLAKGHKRNSLYTCKWGYNSKQHICLASLVDNLTLWHRRLGHSNLWVRFLCKGSPKSITAIQFAWSPSPINLALSSLSSFINELGFRGLPRWPLVFCEVGLDGKETFWGEELKENDG